ncbi:MAG TPA: MBL fold metallo-hydrolase [Burkholderiaceae bacterium]|jgi:glyoxylase-like metal-dependent hydrolase (beta-lactamase superfamily II)|nr:MBL fold metallo-hydrolase [Burkholderiaceae bacterium]
MSCLCESFFEPTTGTITHVVACPVTRRCAIVDSVLDYDARSGRMTSTSAQAVVDWVQAQGLQVEWLLETHAHADHLSAAPWLRQRMGGRIAIGARITEVQRTFGLLLNAPDVIAYGAAPERQPFDHLFQDDESFLIGALPVRAWHTPGHTPACVSFVVGAPDDPAGLDVFVGDTLFMPDYGSARCDFPGGSATRLYRSVRRVLALPADTRLHLCHDYPPKTRGPQWQCTVAEQRAHNVHLHEGVGEEAFVQLRTGRDATLGTPTLLWPSIQMNVRAGHLPPADESGARFVKIPLEDRT